MQSKDEKSGMGFGSVVLWIVVALVVYFLSIGPAAWLDLHSKSPALDTALRVIYSPLELADKTPLE
ncbi:MAG: hypothetical protein ACREO5_12700, partial [Candidatus Binatia bacterium]